MTGGTMTPARLWRLLPLLLAAVVGLRLWLAPDPRRGGPAPGFDLPPLDWAERLPGPPDQDDQQPWLSAVLASPVWGWPKEETEDTAATPSSSQGSPASAPAAGPWVFAGTYFDGFTRRALVLDHEARVSELEPGDRLPSGETIRSIQEDEMLLEPQQEDQPVIEVRVGRSVGSQIE